MFQLIAHALPRVLSRTLSRMKRAVVVGAGIVGFSTALYLQKKSAMSHWLTLCRRARAPVTAMPGLFSRLRAPEATPESGGDSGMLFRAPAPVRLRPAYLLPFSPG